MSDTKSKTLVCPDCGGVLSEIGALAHYNRQVIVDLCSYCGGVWFDKWELYSLTEEGLRSLQYSNTGNPAQSGGEQCPRCASGLVPYIDPMLPKDAGIRRCDPCSGLWLNRNALTKYSSYKENVLSVKTLEFKISETDATRRLEIELTGTARTSPIERINATPKKEDGVPNGSGSFGDGIIGTTDAAK